MKRMYDERVQDLITAIKGNKNGDIEVGKNLEVDGGLKVNGAINELVEFLTYPNESETFRYISINSLPDDRTTDVMFQGVLTSNDISAGVHIQIREDGVAKAFFNIDGDDFELLDESNVNKLAHLYRHTIEISNDTSSVVFQANLDKDVVIDSVQDLVIALGSTQLSASGYVGANIVSKITIGSNAGRIKIKTNGGQKTLTDIANFVISDDVTL